MRNVSGSNILPYCVPIKFLRHLKLIQRPKILQNFVTTTLAVRQKIYGHNIHYSSLLLHIKMSKPKISRAYEFLGLIQLSVGSFVLCIFKLNRTNSKKDAWFQIMKTGSNDTNVNNSLYRYLIYIHIRVQVSIFIIQVS